MNDGGVDHGVFHIRLIRERIEYPFEDIAFDPIAKALEDRVPVAESCRQIAPRTAGPRDPQHSLQEHASVRTGAPGIARLAQTQGLNLLPLRIRQAKPIHQNLHVWKFESRLAHKGNPDSQQALEHFVIRLTRFWIPCWAEV